MSQNKNSDYPIRITLRFKSVKAKDAFILLLADSGDVSAYFRIEPVKNPRTDDCIGSIAFDISMDCSDCRGTGYKKGKLTLGPCDVCKTTGEMI